MSSLKFVKQQLRIILAVIIHKLLLHDGCLNSGMMTHVGRIYPGPIMITGPCTGCKHLALNKHKFVIFRDKLNFISSVYFM